MQIMVAGLHVEISVTSVMYDMLVIKTVNMVKEIS